MSLEKRKSILHYYVGSLDVANRMLRQAEQAVGTYDVTIIYRNDKEDKGHWAYDHFHVLFQKKDGSNPSEMSFWRIPIFLYKEMMVFWQIFRQKADIFHPHQHGSLLLICLWLIFVRKPIVFDPHDMTVHDKAYRGFLAKLKRWMERFVIQRTRAVLVVSEGMRTFYQEQYIDIPVFLLSNLPARADVHKVSLNDIEDQMERSVELSKPVRLVYAGQILQERLPMAIIRAVGQHAEQVTLDILGFSSRGYDDDIRHCIENEGFGNISLKGPYNESDIVSLLCPYDYFILPYNIQDDNIRHCMPNKVYQALAAGLPLIASEMVEVGHLIRNNDIGYMFADGDITALSNIFNRLNTSSREYLEQRRAVNKIAQELLDYEAYRSQLLSAYDTALQPGTKGSRLG